MATVPLTEQFPRSVTLPDGTQVDLRVMTLADRAAVLAFARSLSQEDLLFLRVDLTQEAVVDDWIRNVEAGYSTTLVAYDQDGLIGYAAVHRNPAPWTRRVGEIRVNVSASYRGRGLGRVLTARIFDVARGLGLAKLVAHMTSDQHGAQAAFRRLGFVPEAVLADSVEDRAGRLRDLVIMTFDIDGHSDRVPDTLQV
jgi:RimJ/RimL family protein N-acetyltransferase